MPMRMPFSFRATIRSKGSALVFGEEFEDTNHQPAAHLADEHLQSLNNGLFEVVAFLGVFAVAVSYADHVLCTDQSLLALLQCKVREGLMPYLIFGEKRVAYAREQHHAHEERYHCFDCHFALLFDYLLRVNAAV
jgi:hypothetical protein